MIHRRSAVVALIVVLVALTTTRAGADQTDARLTGLFAQLRVASSAAAAQPVEARIWDIWMEAGDPVTDRLMATGVVAMNAGDYGLALKVFGRLVKTKPAFAEG